MKSEHLFNFIYIELSSLWNWVTILSYLSVIPKKHVCMCVYVHSQ